MRHLLTGNTSDGHLTQSQALGMLRSMMFLIQKVRANANDPIFGLIDQEPDKVGLPITKELLAGIMPWAFDDNLCPVPALAQIIDRAEQTGILAPMDFYNMMTILYRFLPSLVVLSPLMTGHIDALPIAPPDHMVYLKGWAPERSDCNG